MEKKKLQRLVKGLDRLSASCPGTLLMAVDIRHFENGEIGICPLFLQNLTGPAIKVSSILIAHAILARMAQEAVVHLAERTKQPESQMLAFMTEVSRSDMTVRQARKAVADGTGEFGVSPVKP